MQQISAKEMEVRSLGEERAKSPICVVDGSPGKCERCDLSRHFVKSREDLPSEAQ